jgi:phenylacetate-CoA ligase
LIQLINRFLVSLFSGILRAARRIVESDRKLFVLLGVPWIQPLLERFGGVKAYEVYLKAKQTCPAYAHFLEKHSSVSPRRWQDLAQVPETNKENYVKKYPIEERCYEGRIPASGVVIDESSGSSGVPNNWVRGPQEREAIKRNIQLSYALLYHDDFFLLNCFALGPWATGMNVSMSLVDVAVMKSLGPDKIKLENSLKTFGKKYKYLIMGYPPFIKNFADTTALNLKEYDLHLIVGGEGLSEGLRDYFYRFFKTIHSSYGASDLEINIGVETEFSIKLRKLCLKRPELSKALFGRQDAPMIFQYNPSDYIVEQSAQKELIFTITRSANVAPKIRYNIKDSGGSILFRRLLKTLKEFGVEGKDICQRYLYFPVLYVYGRNDLSVPFYGAKVFSTDIDHILSHDERLLKTYYSFRMKVIEDERLNKTLVIAVERSQNSQETLPNEVLREVFFKGLQEINQDFREVSKTFSKDNIVVEQYDYGQGPFSTRDIRVKNNYFL